MFTTSYGDEYTLSFSYASVAVTIGEPWLTDKGVSTCISNTFNFDVATNILTFNPNK